MTIFVDPYHTTSGSVFDTSRLITPLKATTIREPLKGTNLAVKSYNGIVPVFITGCRDSEKTVPPFTHPIFIKNFNDKSYLFTDMTPFVGAGADLADISNKIRRREEFDFAKSRTIASLLWSGGDIDRFKTSMSFAGEVYATWIAQAISRAFAIDFMDQLKIQLIVLGFYHSLFVEGGVVYSQNSDEAALCTNRAVKAFRMSFQDAIAFYRDLDVPLSNVDDLCVAIVNKLNNVNLNPLPNRPDTGFNLRVMLGLISDAWYSTNSKQILAVALEHPPTFCAIVHYCIKYNNFRRQTMGQIIQLVGKGGKADSFTRSYDAMIEEMAGEDTALRPVMEYLDPSVFVSEESDVQKLLDRVEQAPSGFNKESTGTDL